MKFKVEVFDYGRHGVTTKEPRTRLQGHGSTKDEALEDLRSKLVQHVECDYVPPADGPDRSFETVTV